MSVLCTILSSKFRLYSAKSHPKDAGNRICGTLDFKIFRGSMPPDPPRMAHAFGVRPPKTMTLATPLLSAKKARKELSINDLAKEQKAVSEAIEEFKDIRDTVDEIVCVKEKLSLQEVGIAFSETEGEDDSPDDESNIDITLPVVAADSESEFVTDSESNNPEDWVSLRGKPLYSEEVKAKIKKQHAIFYHQNKRRVAKIFSSKCLLQRKTPPRVSKTVKKYPDIGKVTKS